ncbi:MAG: PepSY domain-containing protein [Planctomycetia bacterium]|nr:PepSY domain-containing protein [Planctomycetia bacterium]
MPINWRIWTRKTHRWGAILVALPFLVVSITGIILQLKKDWTWVQPATQRGAGKLPEVSFDAILQAARTVPEAGIAGWQDIDRLDVRPDRGIVKVQAHNRWEIQVDLKTAQVLQVAYRRSDVIESLHDGSWFHDRVKLWVFLPTAVVVLGLWLTGIYLFFLPHAVRWSRQKPASAEASK